MQSNSCDTQCVQSNSGTTNSGTTSGYRFDMSGYGAAFQCVELVTRYAYARWDDPVRGSNTWAGNAADLWFNHPAHLLTIANGSSSAPAVGDILVFGSVDASGAPESSGMSGNAGHISIIVGVFSDTATTGRVRVFEQNWSTSTATQDLYLRMLSSGSSTLYTIGNETTEATTYFDAGAGGTSYRRDPAHTIFGWLHDPTSGVTNWFGPTVNGIGQNQNTTTQLLTGFHRTSSNQLALSTQTASSSSGGTWMNWSNFSNPLNPSQPGGIDTIMGDPAVGQNNDGLPYVFVRGASGIIYQSLQGAGTGGNYSTLAPIQNPTGITMVSNPAVGRDNASGKLMVFARGSDNHMYYAAQTTAGGTSWGTFSYFSNPSYPPTPPYTEMMTGDPAVGQNSDGMLWVFMRGSPSNLIWVNHQQTNGNFSGWSQLPNITSATNPTVGRDYSTNKLMVFVGASNHFMYYVAQTTAGATTWGNWGQFSNPSTGQAMVGNPKVVMSGDHRLFVFMRGTKAGVPDNIFLNYELQPGGNFSGWTVFSDPGGVGMTGDPSAGLDGSGMLHMLVRGTDGKMYHSYSTGGDWVTLSTFGTGLFA